MRFILRDNDGEEKVVNLNSTTFQANENIFELNYTVEDTTKSLYLKRMSYGDFLSHDKLNWKKSSAYVEDKNIVHIYNQLKLYKGFKPSGLTEINPGSLVTQMPGKVVKINIAVGDKVKTGDTLLILEAMKMENEIKAGMDGEVKTVNVSDGQVLESGHLMIEIE